MVHTYVRSDGLASAVISDQDYPVQVAHNLLNKVRIRICFTWIYFFLKLQGYERFYESSSIHFMAEYD